MAGAYAYPPQIWLSFLTVVLLVALAIFGWRRRSVPGAVPFVVGCLFFGLWVAGAFMEYAVADVAAKIFWVKFQAVWQLPATTAITCFILEYAWPGRWLTRRNLALVSVVPLLFLALILTNDLHHLVWSGFTYDGFVLPLPGPVPWIIMAYAYAFGIANILLAAWLVLHWPQYRWPMAMVLIAQVGGRVVYLLEKVYVVRSHLPLDILMVLAVFVAWAIVLFGFRILDPVPLARQAVIAQMHDGLLVLDAQGRVTSLNPAAQAILGAPAGTALGQPVLDLLPMVPGADGGGLAAEGKQIEICLGTEAQPRHYLLETSILKDVRGLTVGSLLMLHDRTERRRAQARILEQQIEIAMLQEREQLARLQHELEMAHKVQAGLLPSDTPEITGWQFAACWRPAREVAGDYYDFIPLDQGHLGVVMGDVCDKAMPAALFMALTRSIVRASTVQTAGPRDGLALANRVLCADTHDGMFVTLFYGLLQPITGAFSYVNAGHNPPLWYCADKDALVPLRPTGMALGILPDATFDQQTVRLGPGDWILLYTDGLTDASDASTNRFGIERVQRVLLPHRYGAAAELLAALEQAVDRFAGDTPPFDDIALVLLRREEITA
jgi:serine phosphatase RsbU (regulator of sigma subunit)